MAAQLLPLARVPRTALIYCYQVVIANASDWHEPGRFRQACPSPSCLPFSVESLESASV